MPQKRKNRPHGHYCKVCGEYKANEKKHQLVINTLKFEVNTEVPDEFGG